MGNPIKDEGVLNLCSFLQVNTNIEEVNINNVGFGISEDTINKLIYLVENNKNIVMYQCKFNFITLIFINLMWMKNIRKNYLICISKL